MGNSWLAVHTANVDKDDTCLLSYTVFLNLTDICQVSCLYIHIPSMSLIFVE